MASFGNSARTFEGCIEIAHLGVFATSKMRRDSTGARSEIVTENLLKGGRAELRVRSSSLALDPTSAFQSETFECSEATSLERSRET